MLNIIQQQKLDTFKKGPIRRSLFSNGACFNFHHAKGFSGAKINLTFLAGSIFESSKEQGLAHLVEHLLFKETKTKNIEYLEGQGAELNAYTYKECVSFEMDCHSDQLELLIPKFLEHFLTLDFDSSQFKKEKKVICHELKEDKDDHELCGVEELFEKNFTFDVGHTIGGKIGQVKNFTEDDVFKFYKKFFTSQRMIITVVAGKNLNLENLINSEISKKLSKVNKKPFRLKALKKNNKLEHIKKTKKKKMESSISFFSFNAPGVGAKGYYSYVILDDLLFDGMSSILFKALREKKPLVYGMGSSINSYHHSGQYMMIFSGSAKYEKQIKTSLFDSIKSLASLSSTDLSLDSVKKKIARNWELSFDSLDQRVEFIVDQDIYGLENKSLERMKEELFKVKEDDIKNLALNLIKENNYSHLIYKKKDK